MKDSLPTNIIFYWSTLARKIVLVLGWTLFSLSSLQAQSTFTYSLAGFSTDVFHAACEAENGDLLIAGITRSFASNGTQDIYVVRLDKDGNRIWENFYGGNNDEFGTFIVPRQGGGFLIAGSTFSYGEGFDDLYFVAIDDDGLVEWEKTIGDSSGQKIRDLIPLLNGGFAVTGEWVVSDSVLSQSYFLKIDENGDLVTLKFFGGDYFDFGLSLAGLPQNEFMLGSILSVYNPTLSQWENRMLMMGLDEMGNVLWADTIQHPTNPATNAGQAREIIMMSDSTYLAIGDMVARLDGDGNVLAVEATPRAIAAIAGPDMTFLTATDGSLKNHTDLDNMEWEEVYNNMDATELLRTQDGGFLIVGDDNLDMYAIKVNCRGTMDADTVFCLPPPPEPEPPLSIQFFPNPVSDDLNLVILGLDSDDQVSLDLIDLQGRLVLTQQGFENGEYLLPIDDLAPGLYILRVFISGQLYRLERLVFQH